jgi:plastocyanin
MNAGKALMLALVALLAVAGAFLVVASAQDHGPAREIEIHAKDYKFNGTNPTLKLVPGERVRVKFVNDEAKDSGISHNFKIVGINAHCSRALQPGESEVIEADVPETGEYYYTCCAHPGMGGKVELDSTAAAAK